MDADFHLFKTDILNGLCTYSTDKRMAANLETITADRAKEIIEMNKRGEKPLSLMEDGKAKPKKPSADLLAGADISRFDKTKKKKNGSKRNNNRQGAPREKAQMDNHHSSQPSKMAQQRSQRPRGERRYQHGNNKNNKPAEQP